MSKRFGLFGVAAFLAVVLFGLGLITSTVTTVKAGDVEICDDGKDNDGDKLVDCKDPDCKCDEGVPCSPGFWKNHPDDFNAVCGLVDGWTCQSLWAAVNCKGADRSCGRQAAAAALNEVSDCTE